MTSNAGGDRNSSSGCAVGMRGGRNDYAACDDFVRVKSMGIGEVEFPCAVVLAGDPLVGPAATLSSGNGHYNNDVNDPSQQQSSFVDLNPLLGTTAKVVGVLSVAAEEIVCQTTAGDIEDGLFGPCAKNKKARFKKRARKLCRKLHRGQTGDHKRSSFNHAQYHPTTKQDIQAPSIEPILSAH